MTPNSIPYSAFCASQVFQRIDVVSEDFDNIVDLELGAPWPLPPIEATATLAHKFEITGEQAAMPARAHAAV